jgi:hypothetical protein
LQQTQNQEIFNYLSVKDDPKFQNETILYALIILSGYKSISEFSKRIGFSRTIVEKVISGKSESQKVRAAIAFTLGLCVDPWR